MSKLDADVESQKPETFRLVARLFFLAIVMAFYPQMFVVSVAGQSLVVSIADSKLRCSVDRMRKNGTWNVPYRGQFHTFPEYLAGCQYIVIREGTGGKWFNTGQVKVSEACWLYAAVYRSSDEQHRTWQKEGWEILSDALQILGNVRARPRPVLDYVLMRKHIPAGPVSFDTKARKTNNVIWIFKRISAGKSDTVGESSKDKKAKTPKYVPAKTRKINWEMVAGRDPLRKSKQDVYDPSRKKAYVIITTSAIKAASRELSNFVAHKESMGFKVKVITDRQLGGGVGDRAAERIRRWLQNYYYHYNIQYVLLIGNPHPDKGRIPMKKIWDSPGKDEGDPSDFYYADLSGHWDWDGDGRHGEWPDDFGPGGVDLSCEVMVGRIPYYGSVRDLDSILRKTINYERQSSDAVKWRKNALLAIPGKSSVPGFSEQLRSEFLLPSGWRCHRLYDKDYGLDPRPETIPCTEDNVARVWGRGKFGLALWWTHGYHHSAKSVMYTRSVPKLNDAYPAVTVQLGCANAHPETSDNLSYSLLKNGAICTLSGTRGFAKCTWLGRDFVSRIVVEELSAGEALYEVKAFQFGVGWHTLTVFNLYGDPSIRIIPSMPRLRRRFVNCNASPGGDGLRWKSAYKDLQDALDEIVQPGIVREIWVAKGTYKPDRRLGNRAATFRLDKGIEIYGGFAGGEKQLNQRDPIKSVTVLSGDIGVSGDSSDNSYHVVTFKDTWVGAVIDGFTITGGSANGPEDKDKVGGGLYNLYSNPILQNCIIKGNSAAENGGAVYSSCKWNILTLTNCTLSDNRAGRGGAMYLDCRTRMKDCTLKDNSAKWGGGLYNYVDSHPILFKCILWGNKADKDGGEIYNCEGSGLTAGFCNIEGGIHGPKCGGAPSTDGGGNSNVKPLFANPKRRGG